MGIAVASPMPASSATASFNCSGSPNPAKLAMNANAAVPVTTIGMARATTVAAFQLGDLTNRNIRDRSAPAIR